MLALYVAAQVQWGRVRRLLREQTGMVGIEYFVFAAFVVLLLVGVYLWMGPELGKWMKKTIKCLLDSSATDCGARTQGETLQ